MDVLFLYGFVEIEFYRYEEEGDNDVDFIWWFCYERFCFL